MSIEVQRAVIEEDLMKDVTAILWSYDLQDMEKRNKKKCIRRREAGH